MTLQKFPNNRHGFAIDSPIFEELPCMNLVTD